MKDLDIYKKFIGKQVKKKSGKPFKSTLKINTIKDVVFHDLTGNPAYIFVEDQSYVECDMCILQDIEITLKEVERLYPGCELHSVKEFCIVYRGWSNQSSHGEKFPQRSLLPEELIKDCIKQGASRIALRIEHEGEIKEPDYFVYELIK